MLVVAEQLGMSGGEDVEVAVFHKAKALGMGSVLSNLGMLRRLRLQCNRAQDNLPAKLEVCPSLPGVSRIHNNCIRY